MTRQGLVRALGRVLVRMIKNPCMFTMAFNGARGMGATETANELGISRASVPARDV